MAESKSGNQKRRTTRQSRSRAAGSGGSRADASNGTSSSRLSAGEAIQRVREELPELLGTPIDSILGVERDDGGWTVSAQIVELARIPDSMDVLGVYTVSLNADGELAGYKRERRYSRGQMLED
jgi:Gas vesicle synthesis protein GvpO